MTWEGPVWDFYRLMGAVLAANLLTAAFVFALMRYTQLERQGMERLKGNGHLSTMVFVVVFLLLGLMAYGIFDGVFARFS